MEAQRGSEKGLNADRERVWEGGRQCERGSERRGESDIERDSERERVVYPLLLISFGNNSLTRLTAPNVMANINIDINLRHHTKCHASALTPPTRAVKVAAALAACMPKGCISPYRISYCSQLPFNPPLLVMVAPPTVQQKIKNASAWVLPKLPQLLHT